MSGELAGAQEENPHPSAKTLGINNCKFCPNGVPHISKADWEVHHGPLEAGK